MLKYTTTSAGVKLGVAEMEPADQLDLLEACGRQSTNPAWVGMALLVCSVRDINGVPEPTPSNPAQVKALANKLGHAGIAAVRSVLEGEDDAKVTSGGQSVDLEVSKN
jgi:hypothetical protein